MNGCFHRGEIYHILPEDTETGSEQYSGRPAIIVSNEANNKFAPTLEVVYLTTKPKKALPTHVSIEAARFRSIALCEQVRTLEKSRLRQHLGCLSGEKLALVERALALAVAMGLTREQYVTLLPKSVTTAISMDVAAELGGIAALTGAIVILTGIAGNLLAETVCKVFHITDPIAKGVGIGTSAHAVGTSKALQMGEVEGAMSGLSIAVAGVLTAVLCPVFVNFIN